MWTWARRRARWIAAALIALPLLGAVPSVWLYASTADGRHAAADAPRRPVAIVLGAGLTPSGEPTPFLAGRLDIAVDLYDRGKAEAILVSGDNSRDDYDEVGGMRDYLVAAGVPDAKIANDHAGFSTWESCVRARRIFGVGAATVVTQDFHLPRAVALCRAAGIDTAGVGDHQGDTYPTDSAYGYLRELPAAVPAVVDSAVRPDPTFLGPRESSVAEALRAPRD
ncbi:vancomycin permeability regulator SanA [Murinocardiopsis flavida]|uniref:Vancomycin permeability regulator SanA n=1 Tax=Murinocardiopsis flavida TaxID=645275 RepID=A0A2P8D543_9ACTN|nr:vancomycin permeability regulator SanA [Murinocardiopsis flavida]